MMASCSDFGAPQRSCDLRAARYQLRFSLKIEQALPVLLGGEDAHPARRDTVTKKAVSRIAPPFNRTGPHRQP